MSTSIPTDMIERAAVAVDPGAFDDSICSCPGCKLTQERSRDTAREQATRALTAALGDTHVMAPRHASDKMICAALDDWDLQKKAGSNQTYGSTWTAMLSAATGSQG